MKTKLGKVAYYLVFNGVFAAALYFGFYEGIVGAQNLALFIGWFTGLVGAVTLFGISKGRAEISKALYKSGWTPTSPLWFNLLYDVCVLAVFVWTGHYVLAVFYLISIFAGIEIRKCQKEYTFEMLTKGQ